MKEPLLISACLLGTPCRYDGQSRPLPAEQLRFLRERYELCPVCPESDGGLPTPRIHSERRGGRVVNRAGEDVSAPYARGAARALAHGCTFGTGTAARSGVSVPYGFSRLFARRGAEWKKGLA